ncbi:oligogalacturonate-specific porin KdgM family protein [Vibrio vulnificus]|uniref:oligogalacturonate-specific porin KdgM family protein n=1 Tax=Vibrio vulnificus TaxID=672 RepID=UPI0024E03EB6|nr:oligogalacturonate-specific porin KdgM family protein [Vibrio vulnificus]EHI9241252.1 porin [Vibrio vulnificus]MDK2608483.1 oligogalacturonate-specific porin KdgM family protein [Vibrio vulnificus]MDK2613790.1 oligogalacturonate-specific porin KdgM family protein [Vibrio vulnificus]MDK2631375.1 oligogalacturonate-specific porin KdgM family protein [Vibrio vulnificus]MDK2706801.1 oligogalacturonate-specific porin KdgM family protein [Vibrio vulnificus]
MNRNLAVSFLALSATAVSSFATADGWPHGFIDYRHEYLDKDAKHYDRVMMGNFFSNGIGVLGELRYATKEGGERHAWDPSSFNNNGMGLSIVYKFKPLDDKKFWLEPMFWLDSSKWWSTYELGMTVGYDFSREWRLSGRYRYDMDKATSDSKAYGNTDRNNERYDVWLKYNPEGTDLRFTFNGVYYDNDYITWNNGKKDYALDLKVGYKLGSWEPYFRLADKRASKTTDERQLRYRVGVTYSW